MKIALLGYGKMGHAVESCFVSGKHELGTYLDTESDWLSRAQQLAGCDVAIEFSQPASAPRNLIRCFEARIPVVCGTTGWQAELPKVIAQCEEMGGSLLYSSNFSIGVNLFMEINRRLAQLMQAQPYEVSMEETHHTHKLDKPSGTAITLAEDIIANNPRYQSWQSDAAADGTLPINSFRVGEVPGNHTITWASEADKITIAHEALNRLGFARGALAAAEWLIGRKGIFTLRDMLFGG